MKYVGLCMVMSSLVAFAGDDVLQRESIMVGETIERDVGIAIGVVCDSPEIVEATMTSRNSSTNVLVLTGRQEGKTLCRAGTNPMAMSYLFEITVRPKGSVPRR